MPVVHWRNRRVFSEKCKKDEETEIANYEETLKIIEDLTNFLKGLEKLLKENIASQTQWVKVKRTKSKRTQKKLFDEAKELKNLYSVQNYILDNLDLWKTPNLMILKNLFAPYFW